MNIYTSDVVYSLVWTVLACKKKNRNSANEDKVLVQYKLMWNYDTGLFTCNSIKKWQNKTKNATVYHIITASNRSLKYALS